MSVTDKRQTDRQTDGRAIAYSEREREFTFAKKTKILYRKTYRSCETAVNRENMYSKYTQKQAITA